MDTNTTNRKVTVTDLGRRVTGDHPLLVNGGTLLDIEVRVPTIQREGYTEAIVAVPVPDGWNPEQRTGEVHVIDHLVGKNKLFVSCPPGMLALEQPPVDVDIVTAAAELAMWIERGEELLGHDAAAEHLDLLLIDTPPAVIHYAITRDWIEVDDTPNEQGGNPSPTFFTSTGNPFKNPSSQPAQNL